MTLLPHGQPERENQPAVSAVATLLRRKGLTPYHSSAKQDLDLTSLTLEYMRASKICQLRTPCRPRGLVALTSCANVRFAEKLISFWCLSVCACVRAGVCVCPRNISFSTLTDAS